MSDELNEEFSAVPEDMETEFEEKAREEQFSILKDKLLSNLTIEDDDGVFDADNESQARITATVATANFLFIDKLNTVLGELSKDPNASESLKGFATIMGQVFEGVYIDQPVPWRTATKEVKVMNGRSMGFKLYAILQKLGGLIINRKVD